MEGDLRSHGSIRTDPTRIFRAGVERVTSEHYPRESMAYRLSRFYAWLQYRECWIRDVNENTIPLIPNRAQMMVLAAMMVQALLERPIRIVVLKARKVGVSTIIQAWTYFNCKFYRNQNAVMLAHQTDSTKDIFRITARIAEHDTQWEMPPTPGRMLITFHKTGSFYQCLTAGGEGVGAGGTPNLLHRSELALWIKSKKVQSDYTSGNAVPTTPTSMIVDESTARGQDLFWGRFKAASRPDHPFEPVFIPWFVDETLQAEVPDEGLILDATEVAHQRRARDYGMEIGMEAFAWRRNKIAEIGAELFKQEFPSTPEEAIESRRGLVLPGMRECLIDELPFDYSAVPYDERVGGWDYGYGDPTVLGAGVYRDRTLYILRVFRTTEANSDEYAGEVMEGHTYYCDPSALGPRHRFAQDARAVGKIHATFAAAPRAKGTGPSSIVKQELDLMQRWIGEGRIKILAECAEQLLIEADSYEWNPVTGEPDKTRTAECGHFDTLDMLRYMVMGVARTVGLVKRTPRTPSVRRELRR